MRNHIIFFSGGKSSFTVAHLVKERFPNDNILLYFTDTNWEDEDLYRFIYEASDKLKLPMLYHSMGINPIQLMYKQHVVYNSRIGNCSRILKMKVAADFLKKAKEPEVVKWHNQEYLKTEINPAQGNFKENTTLYFGIGWDEMHREEAIKRNWLPFTVEMPLIDEVIDNEEILKLYGIKRPRLYDLGFVHNNCKGRCVKAGQAHFKNLADKLPDVFQELLEQEHHMKNFVSAYHQIKKLDEVDFDDDVKQMYLEDLRRCYEDYFNGKSAKPLPYVPPNLHLQKYSFMKKTKNKVTSPYQLRDLKSDMIEDEKQIDLLDFGGCGCFVDYGEEQPEPVACSIN